MGKRERLLEILIYKLIYLYLILLFGFIGLIAIISYKFNNDYIKLWKEIYLILIVLVCYIKDFIFHRKSKRFIILNITLVLFLFYFIYSKMKGIENFLVFYQIKLELPLLLLYSFFSINEYLKLNKDKLANLGKLSIRLVIISVLIGILSSLFPELIIKDILKLPLNSRDAGVTTIYSGRWLRPFGIFQNYVQYGELSFLYLVFIIEKYKTNNYKRYFIIIILSIGIILSTYKTCYLGIIFYIIYKFLTYIKFNNKLKALIFLIFMIFQQITYMSEKTYIVLKEILGIKSQILEVNLYPRVKSWNGVFLELKESSLNLLLGLGLGKNGETEVMKRFIENADKRQVLDSLFLSIFSNYGIVVGMMIIFYGGYLAYKEKNNLVQYVYIYYFFISFYLNNFISPSIIIAICIVIFSKNMGEIYEKKVIKMAR